MKTSAEIVKNLLTHIPTHAGQTYLDVGCGKGEASRYVAKEQGLIVTGLDADAERIAEAQAKGGEIKNLTYLVDDAQSLPFSSNSFDFVFSCRTTHHIPDWQTAFREMVRVVKPGGYLLFSELRWPICSYFIKQRLRGKLGPFPRRLHVEKAAESGSLQLQYAKKRLKNYDYIWQKTQ